jgi:hypothetical protein
MQESIKVHLDKNVIILKFQEFDGDISMDEITQINSSNLYGEMVTISSLLNRVGLLKAAIENNYAEKDLDFKIYESNSRKEIRSNLIANGEKYTEKSLEDDVITHPTFKDKKLKLYRLKRDVESITSLFWAVKDKAAKLDNLKGNLTPTDFENGILEGVVNTIMIKKVKKTI